MINNRPASRWVRCGLGARIAGVVAFVLGAGCRSAPVDATEELYQGTAELDERTLAFEVAGRVTAVAANEGDRVKAGALLATVDLALDEQARQARELEARAARAEATVVDKGVRPEQIAVTKAQLRAARAAEELAGKQLARERELQAAGATPDARVDQLDAEYAQRIAERESLESQLREQQRGARPEERTAARAKAEAAQANVMLDDLRIGKGELRAPADGIVLDVHVKTGELVTLGAPVMTLADPGRLYAYVFVPQGKLTGIDVGDRASVRADGVGRALAGHVENVARRTEFTPRYLFSEKERANLVVRVKVRIDDPDGLLHAGVPLRVSIDRNTPPAARTLEPAAAAVPSVSPPPARSAAAGVPSARTAGNTSP
jgi:HlyD family secretion protein